MTYRDPTVAKLIPCEDLAFGEWVNDRDGGAGLKKKQLHLTVAGDNDIFWLSDRCGHAIKMSREELLELLTLLNKRMPLDALGSI